MESINLFEAIREMRRITSLGRTFSMVHATYNFDTGEASGKRYVRKAKLRPQAKGDDVIHADHKLCYYDVDAQVPRNCWQILILFFNGMKVII
jgi:hypothetical protein